MVPDEHDGGEGIEVVRARDGSFLISVHLQEDDGRMRRGEIVENRSESLRVTPPSETDFAGSAPRGEQVQNDKGVGIRSQHAVQLVLAPDRLNPGAERAALLH